MSLSEHEPKLYIPQLWFKDEGLFKTEMNSN